MRDAYTGEAQFLAWGDGPAGPWVKILLPDSDALGPFRGMTAAKKTMAGQLLAVKIVEVQETDGTEGTSPAGEEGAGSHDPGAQATPAKAPAKKAPQKLSQYAALLCQNPDFHRFLANRHVDAWRQMLKQAKEDPTVAAAIFVREYCGIDSRALLDHSAFPHAIRQFHSLREEFHEWAGK